MTHPKNAEYQKAYRDRQRKLNPIIHCNYKIKCSGAKLKSEKTKKRLCCSSCWPYTEAGKAETCERVKRSQKKKSENT